MNRSMTRFASLCSSLLTILLLAGCINLGPDYFEHPVGVPLLLVAIYILMGIAPLAAWRRSTARPSSNGRSRWVAQTSSSLQSTWSSSSRSSSVTCTPNRSSSATASSSSEPSWTGLPPASQL